jgi:hypothetical protein
MPSHVCPSILIAVIIIFTAADLGRRAFLGPNYPSDGRLGPYGEKHTPQSLQNHNRECT